jgi:hypothetical protein
MEVTMNVKKRIVPMLLAFTLTFTMMPAEVFALPTQYDPDVQAIEEDKKAECGDVERLGDFQGGVNAESANGHTAEIAVTGNITSRDTGVNLDSFGNGSTSKVEVSGNVSAEEGTGIEVSGNSGGNATVKVEGDVSSKKDRGIEAGTYGKGSTAKAEVGGDVESSRNEFAVKAEAINGGDTEVNVNKGIRNTNDKGSGAYLYIHNMDPDMPYSQVTLKAGSIEAAEESLRVYCQAPASVNAVVQNDVISTDGTGLYVDSDNGGKIDVLINGTLHGEKTAIQYRGDDGEEYKYSDITVWKIETGEGGSLFKFAGEEATGDTLDGIRKNVHYIVKIEQSNGATLSAVKADGSKLDKWHDLDTAIHGEKVLLKVDLQPGYKLDGAYNGKGEKVKLLQDKNGNYYVIAEDGGGIYLSVAVSKAKHNISFNLGGGSYNGQIGTITQVYDYGTAIKLLGTPKRDGYKFLYWKGSRYDAGADYTVEGDHLFTAVWEKIAPKDSDKDNNQNQEKEESDKSDKIVKTASVKTVTSASPATGDGYCLAVWISIMAASVLALLYAYVRKRAYSK